MSGVNQQITNSTPYFEQQPMKVVNPNQSRSLRRATYVQVKDLTNSYCLDHERLEEEFLRVKQENEKPVQKSERSESLGSVPTELDTSYPQMRLHPPRGGNNMVVYVIHCLVFS